MKRGLKGVVAQLEMDYIKVATYAPMKRGLKEHIGQNGRPGLRSSNLCPDEKGTESLA